MPDREPIPLNPIPIDLDSPEFLAIRDWPFADSYVGRMLRDDVPQRVRFNNGRVWAYRDPSGRFVGFGSLDLCEDYRDYTSGRHHPYISLLAVNPTIPSLGYGTSIVQHLIGEAAFLVRRFGCHDILFLDVYVTNVKAIDLYRKCGFVNIVEEPIKDLRESDRLYFIMAKRVAIARA